VPLERGTIAEVFVERKAGVVDQEIESFDLIRSGGARRAQVAASGGGDLAKGPQSIARHALGSGLGERGLGLSRAAELPLHRAETCRERRGYAVISS
jgi:hypothetical protein